MGVPRANEKKQIKKQRKQRKITAPFPGSKDFNAEPKKKTYEIILIYALDKNERSFINELISDIKAWIGKYNKNDSTPQEDKKI